jgi:anti-sigma factor RsiW
MECAELAAALTDLLEGDLDDATERAALEHLATCERCDTVLTETRTVAGLAGEYGTERLDPTARHRLLSKIIGDPG